MCPNLFSRHNFLLIPFLLTCWNTQIQLSSGLKCWSGMGELEAMLQQIECPENETMCATYKCAIVKGRSLRVMTLLKGCAVANESSASIDAYGTLMPPLDDACAEHNAKWSMVGAMHCNAADLCNANTAHHSLREVRLYVAPKRLELNELLGLLAGFTCAAAFFLLCFVLFLKVFAKSC